MQSVVDVLPVEGVPELVWSFLSVEERHKYGTEEEKEILEKKYREDREYSGGLMSRTMLDGQIHSFQDHIYKRMCHQVTHQPKQILVQYLLVLI